MFSHTNGDTQNPDQKSIFREFRYSSTRYHSEKKKKKKKKKLRLHASWISQFSFLYDLFIQKKMLEHACTQKYFYVTVLYISPWDEYRDFSRTHWM